MGFELPEAWPRAATLYKVLYFDLFNCEMVWDEAQWIYTPIGRFLEDVLKQLIRNSYFLYCLWRRKREAT